MVHSSHSYKHKKSCKSSNSSEEKHSYNELYSKLIQRKKKIEHRYEPVFLHNEDFATGTYIIDRPGVYVLCEDIVFNPNPDNDYQPLPGDKRYQSHAFSLGFFAAIIISTKNFFLDLNHHKIEQSKEHALQQRFFAIIELADSPFIPNQGPGHFGKTITSARYGVIANGKLCRTSHHGIHGNNPKYILFEKLDISDFEVAGIALNGSDSVIVKKVDIHDSRDDVPVLATYSAARFIRFFTKDMLVRYDSQLTIGEKADLNAALSALEAQMDLAFTEIMNTGQTTVTLFRNDSQLPDGNMYALLLHPPGVAIDDFITEKKIDWTTNAFITRVKARNLKPNVDEVIGLSQANGTNVQNDVVGSVLQIQKITDMNGMYNGTTLSDLQILVAEVGFRLGVQLGKSNITQATIDWATNNTDIQLLLDAGYQYKCNGDSMFHVNKGAVAFRFDGVDNLSVSHCLIENINNRARMGNEVLCGAYETSHDQQKQLGYQGTDTKGINLSYCKNVTLENLTERELISANGEVVALDVMNSTKNVCINDIYVRDLTAGTFVVDAWVGENFYGDPVPYIAGLPNEVPNAVGIKVSEDSCNVDLSKRSIKRLSAAGAEVPVWIH